VIALFALLLLAVPVTAGGTMAHGVPAGRPRPPGGALERTKSRRPRSARPANGLRPIQPATGRRSDGQWHHRTQVQERPQEGRGQVLTPLRALVPQDPARHARWPRQAQVRLPRRLPHQGHGTIGTRPGARAPGQQRKRRPCKQPKPFERWR
jgi:hypothetical protein